MRPPGIRLTSVRSTAYPPPVLSGKFPYYMREWGEGHEHDAHLCCRDTQPSEGDQRAHHPRADPRRGHAVTGADGHAQRPQQAHRVAGTGGAGRRRAGARDRPLDGTQGAWSGVVCAQPALGVRRRARRRPKLGAGRTGRHHRPVRRAHAGAHRTQLGAARDPDRRDRSSGGRRRRHRVVAGDPCHRRQFGRARSHQRGAGAGAQPARLGSARAGRRHPRSARCRRQLRERRQPGRARRELARSRRRRRQLRVPLGRNGRRAWES